MLVESGRNWLCNLVDLGVVCVVGGLERKELVDLNRNGFGILGNVFIGIYVGLVLAN